MHALQRRISEGVEGEVAGAEQRGGGIDAVPEDAGAEDAGGEGEEESGTIANKAADEGPIAGAAHFGVVGELEEHVEGVCGGDLEEGAAGQVEECEGAKGGRVGG